MSEAFKFEPKSSYSYEELLECGRGNLFGPGNAQLPLPPMLMFDRITHIAGDGGAFGKGRIEAELDVHPGLWFFKCHFEGDPVMPGCLGLDAMWQLVGFFLGWNGLPGRGRALRSGEVKFTQMVTPVVEKLRFEIDVRRLINRRLVLAIADAVMLGDGEKFFEASDLRVGLFQEG